MKAHPVGELRLLGEPRGFRITRATIQTWLRGVEQAKSRPYRDRSVAVSSRSNDVNLLLGRRNDIGADRLGQPASILSDSYPTGLPHTSTSI